MKNSLTSNIMLTNTSYSHKKDPKLFEKLLQCKSCLNSILMVKKL